VRQPKKKSLPCQRSKTPLASLASANEQISGCGQFRPRSDHHGAGNPYYTLFRPDPRTGRHGFGRVCGNIRADRRKITVCHFKNLRAMMPSRALLPPVLSKSSQKHKRSFLSSSFKTTIWATVPGTSKICLYATLVASTVKVYFL
jgi:hypothetical protein